jgi:hypothetical protein
MVKLEYTGKQQSTIWDGPATQVRYRFGVDRKVGWVDPRDAGERGVSGFLKLKDRHDNWLFKLVTDDTPVVGVEATPTLQTVPGAAGGASASGTLTAGGNAVMTVVADPSEDIVSATVVEMSAKDLGFPDPGSLYPSDIKRLKLTKEQWEGLYRAELAGKNRQAVKTFVEEQIAGG